jgi:hypothetical protein
MYAAHNLHPFFLGADVPGAPVADLEMTQKSSVVPHCPQTLQQTFRGQGFNLAQSSLVPEAGFFVPGACGPQTALGTEAGKGGDPVLRHICAPLYSGLQPFQPHVFLLKSSIFSSVSPWDAAMVLQSSSGLIV